MGDLTENISLEVFFFCMAYGNLLERERHVHQILHATYQISGGP